MDLANIREYHKRGGILAEKLDFDLESAGRGKEGEIVSEVFRGACKSGLRSGGIFSHSPGFWRKSVSEEWTFYVRPVKKVKNETYQRSFQGKNVKVFCRSIFHFNGKSYLESKAIDRSCFYGLDISEGDFSIKLRDNDKEDIHIKPIYEHISSFVEKYKKSRELSIRHNKNQDRLAEALEQIKFENALG